jgi:hypothetical protein
MKRLVRILALALPLTLAAHPRAADSTRPAGKTPAAKPEAKGAAAPAPDAKAAPSTAASVAVWKEYQLQDSGIAVKLPAEPERSETSQGAVTIRTYGVELGDDRPSFGVLCMSFQGVEEEFPPETLDQMAAAMAKQPGMKITKEEKLTAAGLPARHVEVSAEEGGGRMAVRIVLGKGRVYQLMAMGKGPTALAGPEVKAFFESFRRLP